MNNIPDNPARVAPPESPKTFSNIKKLRSEFLDLYVDDDDMDSSFARRSKRILLRVACCMFGFVCYTPENMI